MRCATIAAVTVVLAAAVPARAQPARSPGAAALGEAFTAFSRGDFAAVTTLARRLDRARLVNADYAQYVLAQANFLSGSHAAALRRFRALAGMSGSRFAAIAPWRAADCLWALGRADEARRAYEKLLAADAPAAADPGVARFRIAEAHARARRTRAAIAGFRELLLRQPGHPLEPAALARLHELGGDHAAALGARDRIARAQRLTAAHDWDESLAELALVSDEESAGVRRLRDYWTGMTLFKMRRQYARAGQLLLAVYEDMGDDAAQALFHGARALSRAHDDTAAIAWYQRLVADYPGSAWAPEAQYLSGWLEFNRGNYRESLPGLERTRQRYASSRFAVDALWHEGFAHYLLGEDAAALPLFEALGKRSDKLVGGKGRYWTARTLDRMGKKDEALAGYRALVGRWPLSWYALLARARLAEAAQPIGPFGDRPRSPDRAPRLDAKAALHLTDPALARVDELLAAGLGVEAGDELARVDRDVVRRHGPAVALPALFDRYRRAENYHRPYHLASAYAGGALSAPPKGPARPWWEAALPRAYATWVERYRELGGSPPQYLYAIMRKESGYDPHVVSYADAIGLLQMIPATTRRVAAALDMPYTDDLLFDRELNIKVGAWYIGRLLAKFGGQIPIGAGSFNSGPRPVMRWLDQFGGHPMDEFVELCAYTQTREYMKKVTEIYAQYRYLYDGVVYEQPLTVDPAYRRDDLTY